jgi:tetratricopeptide (TPR) repeat protein
MYEAIKYFLKLAPYLLDGQGEHHSAYIEELNNTPETERHRYRIFTTLRHAQRLYDKEKPDTNLFTSLITPDIVEVTLCLHKLNDYIKDFNEPVYKMVYKVFEDIRTSYLAPYWDSIDNKNEIAHKRLPQTRRILKALQGWDRQWGDDGDRILTEKDLVLLDYLEKNTEDKSPLERLNTLIERFEVYQKQVKPIKKLEAFAELYFFRGLAKNNENKEAIKDYNEAIKLNPQYVNAYNNRGIAQANLPQPQYNKAIKDYNEAIKLNPQHVNAYYNRGITKNDQKKYEDAIKDYSKAIELDPNFALAYIGRGITKESQEKYEEAIEDYKIAIQLAKRYDSNLILTKCSKNLFDTYQKIENREKAQAKRLKGEEQ